MIQLTIMNLTTNAIDTLLIFYFIKKAFHKKINHRVYSIFLLLGLILFNTLINIVFGLANILGFIAILLISTIVFSFLLETKAIKTFLISIMAVIMMFIIEMIVVQSIILAFSIPPSIIFELNFYRILAILLAKAGFFLVIRYGIAEIRLFDYVKLNNIYPIAFISFFNVLIAFMTFILYKYISITTVYDYIYMFGMSIGVIIFSWIIYLIVKRMMLQTERETIWNMKEKEYNNQSFYLKSMQDILQTIKAQRHDFNNYISTLYGLIHMEKIEEAKDYITQLGNSIAYMNEIIETNHPVITALINIKRHRAVQQKIDMDIFIDLPEKLPIDFVDLSVILGNLLDNALEACEHVNVDDRGIELSMYVKDDYLVIQISNSKSNQVQVTLGKDRFTTKKDFSNHGFGLVNVKKVVDKYDGMFKIEDEGHNFKVNIGLLVKKDAK